MNKKKLKISIITPSFNSGDYIERAIKSVLNQDYKNWEHIVIDGGSTDPTVDILKKYKHLKWVSEKDNGQTDAMNKGFRRSVGDVIVYLNADDYFSPGAFSAVISEFEKGAKFVVGNVLVKSPRLKMEFLNVPRNTLEGMLRHWEPNAFCHNPVGYFYRREVQEVCPFNADNFATMDLEFLLDAAGKFFFTKVERMLGCFEDGVKTKTGVTQSKLDYWQPSTFPYLEKHLASLSEKEMRDYGSDRRNGYALVQAHMNRLNKASFEFIPAKDLPLISVIIPTFNCSVYLRRAIDSVLVQGLINLEIIVVDDASTDNTQKLLKKYYKNNPAVHVIQHEKNKKQGASRNTALGVANGKYIFFLDADDWIDEDALLHLASIAEKYNTEIVACGVRQVWENGEIRPYHAHAFACGGGRDALYHFAENRIGSIVWNKLYLREFVERKNLRFIVPYWHEDVIFTAQAIYECKKYISVEDVYCNYFQRDNSTINSVPMPLHLRSYIKLYADMAEFIEHNNLCSDSDGEFLCRLLIKVHCSNDIFPKLINYKNTRSNEDWESQCWDNCRDELGVKGYALADFLICAMKEKKEKKPLVTIITITFDLIRNGRENFFRQCLESVRNQTYENIEHIVVDGASSDGTLNLIKEYANKGWIRYISEPDTGIYDAMNKGVKMAKGDYISFLNSDDYYHSNAGVESSIKALEESGADFSYAPVKMLNEDGTILDYDHPHRSPKISNVFFVMPFCHQTMFTKRSVIVKENMFDANFKSAGDYDFVLRLCLKKYKSIFVEDAFVTFRFGGISDANRKQSIEEVSRAYFKNYNKMVPITKKECEKIYCHDYDNFPLKLAKKLKNFYPYFNYGEYLQTAKTSGRLKRKIKGYSNELQSKILFALLNPKKFIKKYSNFIIHGKLRKPARKIWYAVRFKKIR